MNRINNNDAPEFIGQIIDVFEDFLENRNIEIPNDEREDVEDAAILFGSDYGEIQTGLEDMMIRWGIMDPYK